MQSYLGLTSEIPVARVRATHLSNEPHKMIVEVTLFDSNGQPGESQSYSVLGDEWMLQATVIRFPDWMNILGLHSGYKLTRLEGRYDDIEMERNAERTVVELNGGDDGFFKTVQQQAWTSPFVTAAYGNGVFLAPDNKTYEVRMSQTGLTAIPVKG